MKSNFVISCLVVASVASACSKSSPIQEPQAPAGGRIEVAEPLFDNGVTVRGEEIRHVFKLKNVGDSAVTILETKASCSCTAAVVSNPVVEPGATADVEVVFNTRGRSGAQSKSVKVHTNSATTPVVILTVSGEVKPAVEFAESNLRLGRVLRNTRVEREIGIVGLRSEGVTLTGLKLSPENDPRLSASIDAADPSKIQVVFNAPAEIGLFRGRIDATTSSPEVPSISMTIMADVTGEVAAQPAEAIFPARGRMTAAGQTSQTIEILLQSMNGKPFTVRTVKDEAGLVKLVSSSKSEEGETIVLEGPLDDNPVQGMLLVEFASSEPLQIPYYSGKTRPGRGIGGPGRGMGGHPGRIPLPGDVRMGKIKVKPWERDAGRPHHIKPPVKGQ